MLTEKQNSRFGILSPSFLIATGFGPPNTYFEIQLLNILSFILKISVLAF